MAKDAIEDRKTTDMAAEEVKTLLKQLEELEDKLKGVLLESSMQVASRSCSNMSSKGCSDIACLKEVHRDERWCKCLVPPSYGSLIYDTWVCNHILGCCYFVDGVGVLNWYFLC